MKTNVGIEALHFAVPRRYVDLEDLARARGVDPAKYISGLGGRRMAVAEPGEDTAALAATAADRVLRAAGADVSKLGMLVVGTETGVDHSKPVASQVQQMLSLPRSMRVFDTQHACYGGTAALMAAAEWIASGVGAGRSALVICSDIARYGVGTAGEPTQGAAAVALLVSSRPELLRLDLGLSGVSSAPVYDFWRPLGHREAQVDGKYSIACYLDALSGAYRSWRARALEREVLRPAADGQLPSEQLARVLYHVPFCKMARKAHHHLRRCDLRDEGGALPDAAQEAEEAARSDASFERQTATSLRFCEQIGNAYTGSLYLGLAGLLDAEASALQGKRLGLFSYGSGCCSEFFSGVVGESAGLRIAAVGLSEVLERRERISVQQYERIMGQPPLEPAAQLAPPGTFRFIGVESHRRLYARG